MAMTAPKAVTVHLLEARVKCLCPTLSVIGNPIATIADALKVTTSLIGYPLCVIHCWGGQTAGAQGDDLPIRAC